MPNLFLSFVTSNSAVSSLPSPSKSARTTRKRLTLLLRQDSGTSARVGRLQPVGVGSAAFAEHTKMASRLVRTTPLRFMGSLCGPFLLSFDGRLHRLIHLRVSRA